MRRQLLACVVVCTASGCLDAGLECLAPANPGGGWDLTCRAFAQVLAEEGIGTGPMQVRNLPGAGGGVAFAHVVAEREGDARVIVAASPATTLRLAQRQFGSLKPHDVRWLGAVAADYGLLAVREDAPWSSARDLIAAWRRAPSEVVVAGGSAVGGQDHMKVLMLADAAGMGIDALDIRYVPFDGGGEAVTALLGGFVSVVSGDLSELLRHAQAGKIRVLLALTDERLDPPFDGVPTAEELGYDVSWVVWRGFYVPAGIEEVEYERWLETLESVVASPAWSEMQARTGLSPYFLAGPEFEAYVDRQVTVLTRLNRSLGLAP